MSVVVARITQTQAEMNLREIADIRIKVFREFPYVYDGSFDYEVKYLSRYFKAKNACFVVAQDTEKNNQIVGVATCLPLAEEDDFVQRPFAENHLPIEQFFYFGESVLLPEYRGLGLGHKFFDEREKYARSFAKIQYTTFCAVERENNHPLKPLNYRSLHQFWKLRGYEQQKHLISEFEWLDLGQMHETKKRMNYWIKSWKTPEKLK
ncbi:MAG: GNAT family N-acetyltransferase [Pseudobdellovibrio sp.]